MRGSKMAVEVTDTAIEQFKKIFAIFEEGFSPIAIEYKDSPLIIVDEEGNSLATGPLIDSKKKNHDNNRHIER